MLPLGEHVLNWVKEGAVGRQEVMAQSQDDHLFKNYVHVVEADVVHHDNWIRNLPHEQLLLKAMKVLSEALAISMSL